MLAFQSEGRGRPLLLMHAFPLSSHLWKREIREFSKSFHVIAPDLPGFGTSANQKFFSVADMAQAVAALLDHLKIEGLVFVAGLSMGGYVAFELLRQFPERIAGLGLFSTRATPDTAETREKRFKGMEAIKTHGLEAYGKKMIENLLGSTTRASKPEIVSEVMAMILENREDGVVAALRAMADRRDSSDLLAGIRFPVIIAAGEEDALVKPEDARILQSQIPGAQLHLIPRCGHLLNLEQPDFFGGILRGFL